MLLLNLRAHHLLNRFFRVVIKVNLLQWGQLSRTRHLILASDRLTLLQGTSSTSLRHWVSIVGRAETVRHQVMAASAQLLTRLLLADRVVLQSWV